jgi:hypothetical protein
MADTLGSGLAALSTPVTVLIEKIAGAVGVLYEPKRIVRKAAAEAAAAQITAFSNLEISDIQARTLQRIMYAESRKQENIEKITAQAVATLPNDAKPETLNEDWVTNFFNKCENVSDEEMQSLWANLLSGEATHPGTYSKRTVELVSMLDKNDAELFTRFCQFVWLFGTKPTPIVFNYRDEIFATAGMTLTSLWHLDDIGLINFDINSTYKKQGSGKKWMLTYFGRRTIIEFPSDSGNEIFYGNVSFTTVGAELWNVSGATPNWDFYHHIVTDWHNRGLITSSFIG